MVVATANMPTSTGRGNPRAKIQIFNLNNPTRLHKQEDSPLEFMTRSVRCFTDKTGYANSSIEGRVAIQYLDPRIGQKRNFRYKCHRKKGKQRMSRSVAYPVNCMAFHPRYNTFATAGSDGEYSFWDKDSKQRLQNFKAVGAPITCCEFSANGQFFAYGAGYDWSKGHAFYNKASQNAVMIHRVTNQEIAPRPPKKR